MREIVSASRLDRAVDSVLCVWFGYVMYRFIAPILDSVTAMPSPVLELLNLVSISIGAAAVGWLSFYWLFRRKGWFINGFSFARRLSGVSCSVAVLTVLLLAVLSLDQLYSVRAIGGVTASIPVSRVMCSAIVGTKISTIKKSETLNGNHCFSELPTTDSRVITQWSVPSGLARKSISINAAATLQVRTHPSALFSFGVYSVLLKVS